MKRSLLLIVAALLSSAIPAVRPATIQSNTKQAPHKSILTQDPKDLPPDCQAVHKRSLNLLQEFDAALPVKDKELAIKSVEYGRKSGRTLPQAYEYVGAGAALTEHYPVAVWASLNAARLSWRAESVTNVGVYLFYMNRSDEAEAFLNCARRMAPQSPFPLEALAMIAFKRKTYPLAMSLIEQAVRLMPSDTNVLYTAGVIHYKAGQVAKGRSYLWKAQQQRPGDKTFEEAAKAADPRGENRPPPPKDALAKLIQTTFALFDETLRKGEALAAYANRIERLKRSINPPTYTADKLKVGVIRARVKIEDSERRFRELRPPVLQRLGPSLWNQAVFDCISAYFDVFRAYQDIAWNADPTSHLLANAMDVPADRLVEDLYVAKELPSGVFYLMLRQERLHEFARTYTEAGEEYGRVLDACDSVDANECTKRANRTWCPKVPPRFSVMAPTVDENINAAAGGLKGAVQLELLYTRAVVGEASDFVRAAVRICRPIPAGQRQDPANVLTPQAVDKNSRQLFKVYIGGFVELKSAFIETSYNDFQQDVDSLYNEIDALKAEIKNRCQEPEGIEKPLIDKEIEALIAALKESGEFGAGLMFECEIEVQPYKLSLKMPDEGILPIVGLERDMGGFGVKVEGQPGSDRRGVEVNVGASAAAGGVAADVSVKVWGEYDREGLTDYGAEIEGKLGVGMKQGNFGAACYLGNANARINARVFAESYARAMRN